MRTASAAAPPLVAIALASGAAPALGNLYSTGGPDQGKFAYYSNADTNLHTVQAIADSFTLGAGGTVGSVTFYGIYDQPVGLANTFAIAFYDNAVGNAPGNTLYSTSFSATRTPTGLTTAGFPVYEFTGAIAPFGLAAGTPYWVSIFNVNDATRWGWSGWLPDAISPIADGATTGGPWTIFHEYHRAFTLHAVPAPALAAPLALGLPAARRRR